MRQTVRLLAVDAVGVVACCAVIACSVLSPALEIPEPTAEERETAERIRTCQLEANAVGYVEGVEACHAEGAETLDACKAWPGIADEIQKAQEACK